MFMMAKSYNDPTPLRSAARWPLPVTQMTPSRLRSALRWRSAAAGSCRDAAIDTASPSRHEFKLEKIQ